MPSGRPPLPRGPDWTPPSRSHSTPASGSPPPQKPKRETKLEDCNLFDPPSDLVCPISHEVYSDPVLNSAGQVYERSSIEQHLLRHNTDPITGTRLASKTLTPVYFLKSRAAEFREAAARSCVERATAVGTKNAIRYVRRAAELCDALAAPVNGLSQECVDYIKAHPSNVYDMAALHLFAKGLKAAGQRDKAAAVYFTLLEAGSDRAQQGGLLKQCLACWNVGSAQNEAVVQDSAVQDTVEMLVGFVAQSEGPSAADIVDIAQEANLDHTFITRFCEFLLFRSMPRQDAFASPGEWTSQKQILLKYVQVSCAYIARRQAVIEEQIAQALPLGEQPAHSVAAGEERAPAKRSRGKRGVKLLAAAGLMASSFFKPEETAATAVRALSAIALVTFSN